MASSFRKFIKGIRVVPESSSTSSESGDLEVDSGSGKLKYYNSTDATPNSAVVTEAHQATLTNKTLTSPVLNTPEADTITGISGGALTVQSSVDENLILQAQGTGNVNIQGIVVSGNTITGGDDPFTVQSSVDENLVLQAQGSGNVNIQGIVVSNNTITGINSNPFIIQSDSGALSLQAPGGEVVQIETISVSGNTITGGDDPFTVQSSVDKDLILQAQGTGNVNIENVVVSGNTITGGDDPFTLESAFDQNLTIQSQGTGNVSIQSSGLSGVTIEDLNIKDTTISAVDGGIKLGSQTSFSKTNASFTGFTLNAPSSTYVDITSSISTIEMISIATAGDGQVLILTNRSNGSITIKNLTGAVATQQIVTGVSSDISFFDEASLILVYNSGSTKWHVIGGTQPIISTTSVSSISSSTTLTNANDVVLVTTGASTSQTFLSTDVTTGASGGFNKVNHGFTSLQPITISSTGTLPGGLSAGTVYYVRYQNTDFFSVTTSPNNPFATPINITSQGTGTHTVTAFGLVVTLPSPLSGKKFDIKKIDSASGTVSVIGPSGTTIDGFNNRFILNQNDSITFVSDGTNYFII